MRKSSALFFQMTSRLVNIGISMTFLIPVANSQTTENYRKRLQIEKYQYAADGQEDAHALDASFYAHSRSLDDKFSEYLSETWHDYIISPGIVPEQSKAPVNQPVFKLSDLQAVPPPQSLPFIDHTKGQKYRFVTPRVRKPETGDFNKGIISFRFYGNEINLSYDKLLLISEINSISEESATAFWQQFARSNNNSLIDQLMSYRDLLGLNDWGYFCLLKATALQLHPNDKWAVNLLTWALALHSGYNIKLAYSSSGSSILFPSPDTIYSRRFITIDQTRYYLDDELKGAILATYNHNLKGADRFIDLAFYKSLNFNPSQVIRKIMFSWNAKHYEFRFSYSPTIIRFYENYPSTGAAVYFDSPVSSQLKEDLYSQFYPIIAQMNKAEASAFLQQFVQEAFEYQSLNSQNGGDKFLFPEETFARKALSNNGRAVLYSWLVRNLLKLPVIGLEFQGYLSTAVCFDQPVEGDYYLWQGKRYTYVDPTCLNIPVGIMLPELVQLTPEIINLNNNFSDSESEKRIWNLAVGLGASRGGDYRDIVIDARGKSFITGYFKNSGKTLGQTALHPFVACFSENNSLQWLRKFEGSGNARAFAIESVNQDEIYVGGSFQGDLKMENLKLQTNNNHPDLFFAKFSRSGELLWMKKAGIDSLENDSNLIYSINFDRSGENFYTGIVNEDDRNVNTGFYSKGDNFIYFTGSENGTTGMVRSASKSTIKSSVNVSSEITKEVFRLLKNKCNPSAAGISGVLNTLTIPGTEIKGSQLQALINQYNPSFSRLNPQFYSAIGQIDMLKNESGIISIKTVAQKSITLPGIRMADNARIMLDRFGNGDSSVGVISGFTVGDQNTWIPLNKMLLDISSGNVILDYDADHTLRTINLASKILKSKVVLDN